MDPRPTPLLSVGGLPVHGHPMWVAGMTFVAVLLATATIQEALPGAPLAWHVLLGLVSAAGVLGCFLLHDLPSAWVARRAGDPAAAAAPWLLGAEAPHRAAPAPSAGAELLAGLLRPLVAVGLAGLAFVAGIGAELLGAGDTVAPVLFPLAWINAAVAGFELLPGLPLGGGRVLRAVGWRVGGDVEAGTRLARRVGRGVGLALLALGAVGAVAGSALVGGWVMLVGAFLRRGGRPGGPAPGSP